MSIYTDKWGRYHDKPTDGVNPSSNNGWIYTAYASKVGLRVNEDSVKECWRQCHLVQEDRNPVLLRNPGEYTPPFSRDEFLGMAYIYQSNVMNSYVLFHGWNFSPYPIPKLSIPKLIAQAYSLLKINPYYKRMLGVDVKLYLVELKHRNTFWTENLDQLYRFSFSVPLQDRYSILKWSGRFKFYRPDHLLYAGISMIDRLGKPNGMRYLKYGGEKNGNAMSREFPIDHPIYKKWWNYESV